MNALPDEVLVAVLAFVDHLYGPCFVAKRWYKSCQDAKKHPMIAAKCGDAFSLKGVQDHSGKNYTQAIVNKLCKNGYVDLAYRISNGEYRCELAMLKSGKREIIIPLIASDTISHIVLQFIGWLGPESVAYNLLTERAKCRQEVLRGLCNGGHVDEFKRRLVVTDEWYSNITAYSFGSGQIEFVKYMMETYPIRITNITRDIMIKTAVSGKSAEVLRYAVSLAGMELDRGTVKEDLWDILPKWIRHPSVCDAIDEYFAGQFGTMFDSNQLSRMIPVAPDKLLCHVWKKSGDGIAHQSRIMAMACTYGKFRLCKLINVNCIICGDKYHKMR